MKTYVAAFDGVPGVMPGIPTLSDVYFENEEPRSAPKCEENYRVQRTANIPRHKRRMMPCNKD